MKSKRGRHGRRRSPRLEVLLPIVAAVCALVFAGALLLKPQSAVQEARGDHRLRYQYDNIVEFGGVRYRQRKQITTILLLGVDRDSDQEDREGVFNGGMADFQRLIVVDDEKKQVCQIQIDRDTMTPVTILGPLGDELGEAVRQICVAHSYGDGGEKSIEYARRAVSKFLLNAPVDYCISLRMDGISVLNDLVGGVTVTLEDDFTALDPSMTKGATVTLHGDQAEAFVRRRRDISGGTNEARMKRQQQYIGKLSAELNRRFSLDKNYVGEVYDALGDYMFTDMSRGLMINEVWRARKYLRREIIEIPGTHTVNEKNNMEFLADEGALRDIVLELFYEPLT